MKLTFIISLFLCSFFSHAQVTSVSGKVSDTIENKNLQNTVISLIRTNDSTLYKFTRADNKGSFAFKDVKPGKYIFMVTHPFYADHVDNIEVKQAALNLDNIFLIPKSKLLREVIIRTGAPIKIKGDTTEYTADSFKVRANANVEDLLRKMPGIQVDAKGEIKALGEKVTKVLVDGEEFFGDDPGVAVKNLRADAVDKVQVFDKKSDQSAFTGIDDGKKDKTINLKLKENKKNGYFGKATLSGGLPEYYNNSLMANYFKGKKKIAGYGIMSNTGQTQLGWSDNTNYGGNDMVQTEFDDASGSMMMMMTTNADENFYGGRNGIPVNKNAGLHYSNKSPNLKQSINGGYKIAQINSLGTTKVISKIFLPDTAYNSNSISTAYNASMRNAGNVIYDLNIDSSNTLRYVAKINTKHNLSNNEYFSESLDNNQNFINKSNQNRSNTSDNSALSTSLLWKHKYKKKYRTLSMNVAYDWSQAKNDGFLKSYSTFYKGTVTREDTVDQRNISSSDAGSFTSKLAYTEPLWKDVYMEFSYSFNTYNNINDKISKQGSNGKYDKVIDSLTNDYQFNRMINSPGINFRYNKKKLNYSLGTALGFNNYHQKNLSTREELNKSFTTIMPRASINYKIKANSNLRFNYSGNSVAPSLQQIQPIKNNNDPLNIYEGNPELKQSFSHNLALSYNFYNVLKQMNFYSFINFTKQDNAFVNSAKIDRSGIRKYSTVNANGVYQSSLYSNFNIKIKKLDMNVGAGPVASIGQNIELINGIKSITKTNSYGIGLNFYKDKEKKYSLYSSPSFRWYHSYTNTNKNYEIKYWQLSGNLNGSYFLPKGFELTAENQFEQRQKDSKFPTSQNRFISNAGIKKTFMKNTMEASLMVNDLFNQNKGFDRNFGGYNYSETYYTTLKRYAMLSFTWNFSKNGGKPAGF